MTRAVWNGTGEVRDDEAYYTLDNGEIKGRPYVRQRAVAYLATRRGWIDLFALSDRRRAIAETIDDDAWMSTRHGYLVSAICRAVADHLWATGKLQDP